MRPDICVTGLGCLCAAGKNTEEIMAALYAGQRVPQHAAPHAWQSPDRHPVFLLPEDALSDEFAIQTRSVRMAVHAAREALAQAGLNSQNRAFLRLGICLGSSTGASLNVHDYYFSLRQGAAGDACSVRQWQQGNPALALGQIFGAQGPVQTVVNACASGTDALGTALFWLEEGLCDVVLAGGTDALDLVPYAGFIRLMIYDQHPCRPFDRFRAGLNLGEGAGMLVLERRDTAQKRGARILARLAGYGCAADSYHLTAPSPEGTGLRRAVRAALEHARCVPEDIGFVNAHGTATPDNDRIEALVLQDTLPQALLVATKGYTGHTLGAAGGIEAVLTVRALVDGLLPGSVGFEDADPALGVLPVVENTAFECTFALSQSLAFGGSNAALVFAREDAACVCP